MERLGMSAVDKEGESLAPCGIFAEIAGLQQEDCGTHVSLFHWQQRIPWHCSPERVTVTLLFSSGMLHPSCMERAKFPGQKCAEAKSLAKPEQVLRGVEMLKNKSVELQLAPASAAWTSILLYPQQGTAPSLPPLHPGREGACRHPEPAPQAAASCWGSAGKLEEQSEWCRAHGKSMRVQLHCRPLQGWKSMESTRGGCGWGCSVNPPLLPGHECWQQGERSRGQLEVRTSLGGRWCGGEKGKPKKETMQAEPNVWMKQWKKQRTPRASPVCSCVANRIHSYLLGVHRNTGPPSSSCGAINMAATGRAELSCCSYPPGKSKY